MLLCQATEIDRTVGACSRSRHSLRPQKILQKVSEGSEGPNADKDGIRGGTLSKYMGVGNFVFNFSAEIGFLRILER